jgi:hypothetical protein
LSLGLVERCLKGPGIDLKELSSLGDVRAIRIFLLEQNTGNLGNDLGIDQAVEGADPVPRDRHVLLGDLNHFDIWRRRRDGFLLLAAARKKECCRGCQGSEESDGFHKRVDSPGGELVFDLAIWLT